MEQENALKLLIQRYTYTDVNGHLKETDLINWGAETLGTQTNLLTDEYRSKANNLPITFQEIEVVDNRTPFEELFDKAVHELKVQVEHIINTNTLVMIVGEIQKNKIELLLKDGGFDGWEFRLDGSTYNNCKDEEWYPLGIGDEIEVSLNPFDFVHGRLVTCKVQKVIERHSSYYKEYHERQLLYRMNKDFTCLAGHAIAYVKTEDVIIGQSKKGFPSRKAKVSFHNIPHWCHIPLTPCPKTIFGDIEKKGEKFRIWIFPRNTDDNQKTYFLSAHSTEIFDKWNVVRNKDYESIIAITGTVCQLASDTDESLLWISSEDGKYHNNAFKIDIRKDKENFLNSPKLAETWGKLIRDYLPLGFPATFALYTENKTDKSKIKLRGLLPGLHGRMSTDQKALDAMASITKPAKKKKKKKKNIPEDTSIKPSNDKEFWEQIMIPYQLKDEELLFTSTEYAGHADKNAVPSVLMDYAKAGLFSTEVKIPAKVRTDGNTVRIDVNSALTDEYNRLKALKGQIDQMKICSILFGQVLLTTNGGYPVAYTCKNEKEEDLFRSHMFQNTEMYIDEINEDRIIVKRPSDFPQQVSQLHIGSFFPARHLSVTEGHWTMETENGLSCHILTDLLTVGESIDEGDNLQLLAIDFEKELLIAIARPDRITYPNAMETKIKTIRQLTNNDWLCKTQEDRYAIMHTTSFENKLLIQLQRLYGNELPVMVRPLSTSDDNRAATCRFDGKTCGADYSRVLSGNSMPLQIAISNETPKVLYHDIVMTTSNDEITTGPVQWVVPTGQLDSEGCFLCRRGEAPKCSNSTSWQQQEQMPTVLQGGMAVVTDIDSSDPRKQSLSVQVDSLTYRLNTEEQLHIPMRNFLLSAIFNKGQLWQVKISDENCQLNSNPPKRATEYTLIAKCRKANGNDWVVRSTDGCIGVAENLKDAIQGDKRYMIFSKYYHDCTILEEGDENLNGQQVCLVLDNYDASHEGYRCHQVNCNKQFIIKKEHWNWGVPLTTPHDAQCLQGATFLARIMSFDDGAGTADRRCLLPQCELTHSSSVSEGIYQMEVIGHNDEGYLLEQNAVRALLKWKEAALFYINIDDNDIIEGYLPKGDLITIKLQAQKDNSELQAEWRTLHMDIFRKWQDKASNMETHNVTIHHLYHDHAFLELDGCLIHLTASQLGLWEGQMLNDYYQQGDIVKDCVIHWDASHDCYTFSIENYEDENISKPIENQIYDGHLLRYENISKNYNCFVKFGPNGCWVAKVQEDELSWEPFAEDNPPFKIDDIVKLKVLGVCVDKDKDKRSIMGSIRLASPEPISGPRIGQVELRKYKRVKYKNNNRLCLLDDKGIPAILERANAIEPLDEIITKIENKNYPWLPINGVLDNEIAYSISQMVIYEEIPELRQIAKEHMAVKVQILEIRSNRLLVNYGSIIGSIDRFEATGQRNTSLKEFYAKKKEVECIITNIDTNKATFEASVVQNLGFNNMVGIKLGDKLTVKLVGHDEKQAKVITDRHYIGYIPREEVANPDFEDWANRLKDDFIRVVCIDIDSNSGTLIFSRSRCLGEGIFD